MRQLLLATGISLLATSASALAVGEKISAYWFKCATKEAAISVGEAHRDIDFGAAMSVFRGSSICGQFNLLTEITIEELVWAHDFGDAGDADGEMLNKTLSVVRVSYGLDSETFVLTTREIVE